MISPLSINEYKTVMNEIKKNHWLVRGRCVKYVYSSFDFRGFNYFHFTIRPFLSEPVEFTCVNRSKKVGDEWIQEEGSMFDEIMTWLKQGETKE